MKRFLILPVALGAAFALGCGNTSPTGGRAGTSTADTGRGGTPATDNRGTTPPANTNDKSATFQIKGPLLAPSLKQGEKKNVEITVDRGNNFKDAVKLSAEAPKGLKVEFAKPSVAAGDDPKVAMSVEADKDAPIAEHMIKVTATPTQGAATSLDVKVKVEQAK